MTSAIPQCINGHGNLANADVVYDSYDMTFKCCQCNYRNIGKRWMCVICEWDICFDCIPLENIVNSSLTEIRSPTAIDHIRRQLRVISARECATNGTPVGALLVHKTQAGNVKKIFHAEYNVKLGYQKVVPLGSYHAPDYLIVYLSPRSALSIIQLLGPSGFDRDVSIWNEVDVEYFPGVRQGRCFFLPREQHNQGRNPGKSISMMLT